MTDTATHMAQVQTVLRPIQYAPLIWALNGCGWIMQGRYRDPLLPAEQYYALHMIAFLWLPIVPLRIYLVTERDSKCSTHASINWSDFFKLYPRGIIRLAGSCLLQGAFMILMAGLLIGGAAFLMGLLRSR